MPKTSKKRSSVTEKLGIESFSIPSVPYPLFFSVFCLSFILPNLVFSGTFFFNTLHLMKWAVAFLPIATAGIVAGFRAARHGAFRTNFRLDAFAWIWLVMLLYVAAQPLWTPIRSVETFYREWFFFGSLWLVYVLASIAMEKKLLRVLLWGALLNGALSVVFAELQIRGMHSQFSFIMNVPGQYLANTGQQNMLALWLAICGLGGIFLLFSSQKAGQRPFSNAAIWLLLGTIFHGLVATTSRSGILALFAGTTVLSFFYLRFFGRAVLPKIAGAALLFIFLLFTNTVTNERTAAALVSKLEDVVSQPLSIAKRDSIWATSWTMFVNEPWRGVGLGQYKWNYLSAQRDMLLRWPKMEWQYTMWAHNEFLQWMAESGIPGAAIMFLLWFWWMGSAFRAYWKKDPLSPEAMWGSAMVALFFFNALWTRPFHRIENAIWLALAFAVTNREILRPSFPALSSERLEKILRPLGAVLCAVCIGGLLFFADGVRGDRLLRLAAKRAGGDATATKNLYERAYTSPMVRDTATKELGYFSVELGQAIGNPQMIADGLNVLIDYFAKKPHTDELNFLRDWAVRMNNEGLHIYLDSLSEPDFHAGEGS